jgi:hypothetical protein
MEEISKLEQAIDKLEKEKKEYKIAGILSDWVDEIISEFETAPELIDAVLDPKKTAAGFIAVTAEYGFVHKTVVDKRIVDMCPEIKKVIGNHTFSIGIPPRPQRKKLIKEYYLGGSKK